MVVENREVCEESESFSRDPFTGRISRRYHPRPVLYRLRDVTFSPITGTIGHRGHRIRESVHFDLHRPNSWHSSRIPRPFFQSNGVATAIPLSSNYYHFIAEDLPRIALLKEYFSLDEIYTHRAYFPRFVSDALSALGIKQIYRPNPTRFESLVFVAPMDGGFWPSPIALEVVRKALNQAIPTTEGGTPIKIYLSRRNSARALNSEFELEAHLAGLGFEVVFAEELSVARQVELFSNCRTLVGPHGAGLTNALFMPEGSHIVEIAFRKWSIPVFERIAGTRQRYDRILIEEGIRVDDLIAQVSHLLQDEE